MTILLKRTTLPQTLLRNPFRFHLQQPNIRFMSAAAAPAFKQDPLPYSLDALAPHISAETLDFHYNKHHAGYVAKLNAFVQANPQYAKKSLQDLTALDPSTVPAGLYNNAAQTWNHTFYWQSMTPQKLGGGGQPSGPLKEAIERKFGSFEVFKQKFSDLAGGHFASGWAWLVYNPQKSEVDIVDTHDAGNPLSKGLKPLLVVDVWEHAYYIDYRNARPKYVDAFWQVINWKFAEDNFAKAK